jgi:hypothetical protein
MIQSTLFKRRMPGDNSELPTLEDILQRADAAGTLVRDSRPKRWKTEEDAIADQELMRANKLPFIDFCTVGGETRITSFFPRAVPAFVQDFNGEVIINPEWKNAPIEMIVFLSPDEA